MIIQNRFFRKDSKEAIFLSLYPLLFFPAHGKIKVGREKNIPRLGRDFSIVIKWNF